MSGTAAARGARAATAHHEAGHAVAALLHGVPFSHVSIVPDRESAGHIKLLRTARKLVPMHHHGIVALVGEAAQRRFNPRSIRKHHGAGDRNLVADYALRCAGSAHPRLLWKQKSLNVA